MKALLENFEWKKSYPLDEVDLEVGKPYTVYFDIKKRCVCIGRTGKLTNTQLLIDTFKLDTPRKGEFKTKVADIVNAYHEKYVVNKGTASKLYKGIPDSIEPQCEKGLRGGGVTKLYNTQLLDYIKEHPEIKFPYCASAEDNKARKEAIILKKKIQVASKKYWLERQESFVEQALKVMKRTNIAHMEEMCASLPHDFDYYCSEWLRKLGMAYRCEKFHRSAEWEEGLCLQYGDVEETFILDVEGAYWSMEEFFYDKLHEQCQVKQFDLDGNFVKSWKNLDEIEAEKGFMYKFEVKSAIKHDHREYDGFKWQYEYPNRHK
ncbi:MAG: hypothetical protein LIP02_09155 [Bacteroidales bacterium]|nr:hypothetical protein [Bacteroidales bacterium]